MDRERGKPEGKGPLGRPVHRWEDNPKTELKYIRGNIERCVVARDMEVIADRSKHLNRTANL